MEQEKQMKEACSFAPERVTKKYDKKLLRSIDNFESVQEPRKHVSSLQQQEETERNKSKTPRARDNGGDYFEKLYKKKDEYEAKKREREQKQTVEEATFRPQTTKSSRYKVQKDVIERNIEFMAKKNEKLERIKAEEVRQLKSAAGLKKENRPHESGALGERLYKNAQEIQQKKNQLKAAMLQKARSECSFHPVSFARGRDC